mmetsp:Transcript_95222/g.268997  ORF Transcript_95222/g.268997 Transcript_95222/m.268997 type:complete len:262 (-) Transcript_95222:162-947(-)
MGRHTMFLACGCPCRLIVRLNSTSCPTVRWPSGAWILDTKTSRPPKTLMISGHMTKPNPRAALKDFTRPFRTFSPDMSAWSKPVPPTLSASSSATLRACGLPFLFSSMAKLTVLPMMMPPSTAWFRKASQPYFFMMSRDSIKPKPCNTLKALIFPMNLFSSAPSSEPSSAAAAPSPASAAPGVSEAPGAWLSVAALSVPSVAAGASAFGASAFGASASFFSSLSSPWDFATLNFSDSLSLAAVVSAAAEASRRRRRSCSRS